VGVVMESVKIQICNKCGLSKPIHEFYWKNKRNHFELECKKCKCLHNKEYNFKNKEIRNKKNRDKHKEDGRISLLHSARARAIKKNVPFTITINDIVIPRVCPILGIPLIHGDGKVIKNSPTLDRIIPEKGYIPGNIQVISFYANTIKSDATVEELFKVANYMKNLINSLSGV
jgi:hypothetical protein